MIASTEQATYSDLESMTGLRQQARKDPHATLRQVAKHFESLYLNMMLKSMRQASLGDPIFDSNSSGVYRDMHDSQIALQMSEQNGIGIADMLVKQLQGSIGTPVTDKKDSATLSSLPDDEIVTPRSDEFVKTLKKSDPISFKSHEEFVETLMPYAEKAANDLEVAPQVLIAQAALETGWGQHVQKLPNGTSSYNLFNIKADSRWDGDSLKVKTLEYRDGVAKQEAASFRSYSTYGRVFKTMLNLSKIIPVMKWP